MTTCTNCQAELQPQWKFCIRCGTPVVPGTATPIMIPSAIRPESVDLPPQRRLDIPLLLGIALGIAGVILIVYVAIVLGGAA